MCGEVVPKLQVYTSNRKTTKTLSSIVLKNWPGASDKRMHMAIPLVSRPAMVQLYLGPNLPKGIDRE